MNGAVWGGGGGGDCYNWSRCPLNSLLHDLKRLEQCGVVEGRLAGAASCGCSRSGAGTMQSLRL
jgi:hypothetical protein